MQFSPYFVLVSAVIVILALVITLTRRHINQPGAHELLTALVLVLCALFFFDLSLLFTGEIRFLLHEMKFSTFVFIPYYSLRVYLAFTGRSALLGKATGRLLCVIPLVTILLALTNPLHHAFRAEIGLLVHNGISYVSNTSSWWYWIYIVYCYILYFAGILALTLDFYRRPRAYRNQIGLMIATSICAIAVNVCALMDLFPDYGDIGLVLCALVCVVQYVTLVKYSRKIVVTKIRNMVVGDIGSHVLIYDHMNRLVSANRDADKLVAALEACPAQESGVKELFLPESGEYFSVSERQMALDKKMPTGRVVLLGNITALKKTMDELEHIATHDDLTGLFNRHAFHRELRALDASGLPAVLLCINASGMNLIYSVYGHDHGDKLIVRLASLIRRAAGENRESACARQSGDELGVILKHAGEEEARRFLGTLQAEFPESGGVFIEARYAVLEDMTQEPEQVFTHMAESIRREREAEDAAIPRSFTDALRTSLAKLRDKTGRRGERIAALCTRVAEALALSEAEKERLSLLAAMADVGLLSVSASLVQSIGNLTNEQWEEMKLHTVKGHNIALSIPALGDIAQEILMHHERYDGCGYPMGRKGEEIPLLSRIYAAVEYYADAPPQQAAKLLRARAGTQFDPAIVEALLLCEAEPFQSTEGDDIDALLRSMLHS